MFRRAVLTAIFSLLLLAAATFTTASPALADQAFPSRPVRFVIPFPPGGGADILARMLAEKLGTKWGQSVVVENRPGAGTVIATQAVASAPADGYTLGMVISAHVINPSVRSLPYDTLAEFSAVTKLAILHLGVMVNPALPIHSVAELIAYAKSRPDQVTYGTAGIGNSAHLAGELINSLAGISLVNVPYRGSAPAQVDYLGGNVPILIDALGSQVNLIDTGKIRVLATTSARQHPAFAKYPVLADTIPGASVESFYGVVVRRGTPAEIIQKLNRDLGDATASAEVRARLESLGMSVELTTPEAFDQMIRTDIDRWEQLIRKAGLRSKLVGN
ncbi:MAG: Bug family tripartite tricarboxylate transporter substrate binding protein [Lautropia sp.]